VKALFYLLTVVLSDFGGVVIITRITVYK